MSSGSVSSTSGSQHPIQQKIITIPVCLIGKAVGKDDTTLNALRARSGANISIDDDGQVIITGNIGQIRVAEFVLLETLGESKIIPVKPGLDEKLVEQGVINSIMKRTRAIINVSTLPPEQRSVAVPIEIYGSFAQIAKAERLVKAALISIMKPKPVLKPIQVKSSKSEKAAQIGERGIWMTFSGSTLTLAKAPGGITRDDVLKLFDLEEATMPAEIQIQVARTAEVKKKNAKVKSIFTTYGTVSIVFGIKETARYWRDRLGGKTLLGVPIVRK